MEQLKLRSLSLRIVEYDSKLKMMYGISFNSGEKSIIKTDPSSGELNLLKIIPKKTARAHFNSQK